MNCYFRLTTQKGEDYFQLEQRKGHKMAVKKDNRGWTSGVGSWKQARKSINAGKKVGIWSLLTP